MAEQFAGPLPAAPADLGVVVLGDESATGKWRVWDDVASVPLGKAGRSQYGLVLSVAPGEWIVLGDRPEGVDAVDLTHVRAAIRLTGPAATPVLEHLCALDLSDDMTPNGAAARTLVAGVATELVRDDIAGAPAYLLLVSRSFAAHTWERLAAVAGGLG